MVSDDTTGDPMYHLQVQRRVRARSGEGPLRGCRMMRTEVMLRQPDCRIPWRLYLRRDPEGVLPRVDRFRPRKLQLEQHLQQHTVLRSWPLPGPACRLSGGRIQRMATRQPRATLAHPKKQLSSSAVRMQCVTGVARAMNKKSRRCVHLNIISPIRLPITTGVA